MKCFGSLCFADVAFGRVGGKCEFAAPAKGSCQRHESGHLDSISPMLRRAPKTAMRRERALQSPTFAIAIRPETAALTHENRSL